MAEWEVDMSRSNFKMKCIKDCYADKDTLLYKEGDVYTFINGECKRYSCGLSQQYTSFENFRVFNQDWKNNFILIEEM